MNSDNEGMYTNYKSVKVWVKGTMRLLRIWFGKYHVELLPFVCIIWCKVFYKLLVYCSNFI